MGDPQNSQEDTPGNPETVGAQPEAAETDLEVQLAAALAEADKLRADWLRAKADTENTRRRGQEEVTKAHKFGIESFAASLLGVRDGLEATLAQEAPGASPLKEGVELTLRQLDAVFEKFGVKEVAPAPADKFDPHRHQAIAQAESDQDPNTVVAVLQKGYVLHDRVLRPALVTVAKPRAIDKPAQ